VTSTLAGVTPNHLPTLNVTFIIAKLIVVFFNKMIFELYSFDSIYMVMVFVVVE
jgi:hypothetical protein